MGQPKEYSAIALIEPYFSDSKQCKIFDNVKFRLNLADKENLKLNLESRTKTFLNQQLFQKHQNPKAFSVFPELSFSLQN